jgi:WD40 repeat protein
MPTETRCPRPQELYRLTRGELPEEQAAPLREHLASCAACARLLEAGFLDETLAEGSVVPESRPLTPDAPPAAVAPAPPASDPAAVSPGQNGENPAGMPAAGAAEAAPQNYPQADAYLAPPQAPGEIGRLGPYRVLRFLGAGTVGVVFEAEDPHLKRTVALKALRVSLGTSPAARARFLREAQRTASLEHDNIIEIHEVGEDRGILFLAMRRLQGESLEACLRREGRLPVPDALRFAREAAEGLAAAHARAVIHGDLKLANLWLEPLPAEHGLAGPPLRVKLLDFGLARVLEAPDQAGNPGPHADLSALGSILHRMLTGQDFPPGESALADLRAQAAGPFSGQVAAVLLRLLARAPADRFASAQEAAEALGKLEGRLTPSVSPHVHPERMPVVRARVRAATPTPTPTRGPGGTKAVRPPVRGARRWLVGAALGLGGLLAVLAVVWLRPPANPARKGPQVVAADGLRREDIPAALLKAVSGPGGKVPPEVVAILGSPSVRYPTRTYRTTRSPGAFLSSLALSPDGKTLALGFVISPLGGKVQREIRLHDAATGKFVRALPGPTKDYVSVAFSPGGEALAAGDFGNEVGVWDPASGESLYRLLWHDKRTHCVTFSRDGKRLATGSCDYSVRVWETGTGVEKVRLPGHRACSAAVAFFPDRRRLASGGLDRTVKVWDLDERKELLSLDAPGSVLDVAVSPDGKLLAGGWGPIAALSGPDPKSRGPGGTPVVPGPGGLVVWDSTTGRKLYALGGNPGFGPFLAFSPDGKWLATVGDRREGVVKILDAASGQEVLSLGGLAGLTGRLAFHADGKQLVAAGHDGTVAWWDVSSITPGQRGDSHTGPVLAAAVSPDGSLVASAGADRAVRLWDVATGKCVGTLEGHTKPVRQVAFHPSGATLASASNDGKVKLWDVASRKEQRTLRGHTGPVLAVAFSRDGKRLASAGSDGKVRIWDPASGRESRAPLQGHTGPVNCLAFAPDGEQLASGGKDQTLRVWELATGAAALTLPGQQGEITAVAFGANGQTLATGGGDGTVKVWDVKSGKEKQTLTGHAGPVTAVAFRPADVSSGGQAGAGLATAGQDGTARLWELDAAPPHRTTYRFPGAASVNGVAFTPEGRHLVTANPNGTLYILRVARRSDGE